MRSWDDDDAPAPKEEPRPDPNALKDTSIVWFGKHQGKMLSQVPDDYLMWLYENSNTLDARLKKYIEDNLDTINKAK